MTILAQAEHFLRSLPQLSVLDNDEIHNLASQLHKRKYHKGEFVFHQGQQVKKLFFVEMGKVEVYKSDINGRKLTLWFIGEDEMFCLANLYAHEAFATAKIIEKSIIYSVERDYFDLLSQNSGKLAQNLIRCISAKLTTFSNLLDDMAFKKVEARLATILLSRIPQNPEPSFICSITQEDLAAMAGTSREVISRILKSFRERGLIKGMENKRKSHFIVTNYSLMKEIATIG